MCKLANGTTGAARPGPLSNDRTRSATGPQHQDACLPKDNTVVHNQVSHNTAPVSVVSGEPALVIEIQGIGGPGILGTLGTTVRQLPGFFLERHGHIEALPAAVEELFYGAGEIIPRRLYRRVLNRLNGLAGKQAVNPG